MASFKTAYLQREVPLDLDVVGADGTVFEVGNLVTVTPATATVGAYMTKAADLAAATHIIAQSDMTLGYEHVPVENIDYRYSPEVKTTRTTAPAAADSVKDGANVLLVNGGAYTATQKHVALYQIVDKNDIILDERD